VEQSGREEAGNKKPEVKGHSIVLACLVGLLVMLYAYGIAGFVAVP
jgi:hypothetical protein